MYQKDQNPKPDVKRCSDMGDWSSLVLLVEI